MGGGAGRGAGGTGSVGEGGGEWAIGLMMSTTSTKMMVRLASRMLSAISLGVFCREAPSTSLIVTAWWLIPRKDEASHGAGHSRPVNSGKLFVA